jgi:hypothetical protein
MNILGVWWFKLMKLIAKVWSIIGWCVKKSVEVISFIIRKLISGIEVLVNKIF